MILLADHGLASSTLSVRVAASVRADLYSVIGCGLGTVAGLLHGSASRAVHRLLTEAHATSPGEAVDALLAGSETLPGTGHRVYQDVDPRDAWLWQAVCAQWPNDGRMHTAMHVRDLLGKNRLLNIDAALGSLSFVLGAGPEFGETLFAVARCAGWVAHMLEEFDEAPVRFRARARYFDSA